MITLRTDFRCVTKKYIGLLLKKRMVRSGYGHVAAQLCRVLPIQTAASAPRPDRRETVVVLMRELSIWPVRPPPVVPRGAHGSAPWLPESGRDPGGICRAQAPRPSR